MIPEFLFIAAALVVALAVFAVLRQDKSAYAANLSAKISAQQVHLKQVEAILKGSSKYWAKYEELKGSCAQLTEREIRLTEDINILEPRVGKVAEEVTALTEQKVVLLQQVQDMEDERKQWEDKIKELDRLDEVTAESMAKQKELDELIAETEKQIEGFSEKLKEAESAEEKLKQLKEELDAATLQKVTLDEEMEVLRSEKEEIIESVDTARKELEDLERSRKMLESIQVVAEGGAGGDGKGLVLTRSTFASLFEPEFNSTEEARDMDLDNRLGSFYESLKEHDYNFAERLVKAFHTSLKVQDVSCLTVMAGISGTGKSALPRLYADYMGMHSLIVPVEPRWDSPQDLFGFLNYMENRYEATPLGRALTQFNLNDVAEVMPKNDQVLMVLLDEMNLARVEYYFSEFLSRLETRRDVDWKNDPVAYQKVSMEVFAGEKMDEGDRSDPIRLFAGPNVLFVGTMNEDESTQSLTDKVIDRSNAIHFGRPEHLKARGLGDFPKNEQKVTFGSWRKIIEKGLSPDSAAAEAVDTYLKRLNTVFDEMGRAFGHRSYAATCAYIANHPDGLHDDISDMGSLADQIAMRFMPKLRGIDLRENREYLSRLQSQLGELNDEAIRDAFIKASDEKNGYFLWRGIDWNK